MVWDHQEEAFPVGQECKLMWQLGMYEGQDLREPLVGTLTLQLVTAMTITSSQVAKSVPSSLSVSAKTGGFVLDVNILWGVM